MLQTCSSSFGLFCVALVQAAGREVKPLKKVELESQNITTSNFSGF